MIVVKYGYVLLGWEWKHYNGVIIDTLYFFLTDGWGLDQHQRMFGIF